MATDQLARGLAARTFATARANSISIEEFGARATGDSRAAIQRAIDLAVANGIPKVTSRLPRMEVWEKVMPFPTWTTSAEYLANRTLTIPGCESIEIDFAGARITMKGPTGGARYPGQTSPSAAGSGLSSTGKFLGGFLTAAGAITGTLAIRNVDVEGGFTGDTVGQSNTNLFDKGFLYQDLGATAGTTIMDNVVLHGFGGEIMYDNSSALHLSRDCHFYNAGHSCWNPGGVGRLVAHNLQAGIARQPVEAVGGKGHVYHGGRIYKGSTNAFIAGPDPAFSGPAYNSAIRRTDAAPPYIQFIGTRFEELGDMYLGCWIRGSIVCTDTRLIFQPGYAVDTNIHDVDLDIVSTVDRGGGAFPAVTVSGPATATGDEATNVNLKIRTGRTNLAASIGSQHLAALVINGVVDPSCYFRLEGRAQQSWTGAPPAGTRLPRISDAAFYSTGNPDNRYFTANFTHTVGNDRSFLYSNNAAVGTFDASIDTTRTYSQGQRFEFIYATAATPTKIVRFAASGAGMRLPATRELKNIGDRLLLEFNEYQGLWTELYWIGT